MIKTKNKRNKQKEYEKQYIYTGNRNEKTMELISKKQSQKQKNKSSCFTRNEKYWRGMAKVGQAQTYHLWLKWDRHKYTIYTVIRNK